VNITSIQRELALWGERFYDPLTPTPEDVVEVLRLGVLEEVGELARVLCKRRQKTRGMDDNNAFIQARNQELGDVLVYFTRLCAVLQPDRPISWQEGVVVPSSNTSSYHLVQVVMFSQEEFPALRFSRVVEHLSSATGLHPQDILRVFAERAGQVMGRTEKDLTRSVL